MSTSLGQALTLTKRWHSKDTAKHSLVITVQDTANRSKSSNAGNASVLEEGSSTTGTHKGLTSSESFIKDGFTATGSATFACAKDNHVVVD